MSVRCVMSKGMVYLVHSVCCLLEFREDEKCEAGILRCLLYFASVGKK